MKVLRKHIFLLVLLLQAGTAFAVPDRDSLVIRIIERGKLAFREMARQNRLNDERGLSSRNHYVLHINTADLIDKKIDVLDKEYIKQRKIGYSPEDVGGDAEGQFLVPDGEDLDDLDEDLKHYNMNPNTKVRAYLITVDFIPMIFNDPPPDVPTLLENYRNETNGLGTENETISQAARDDAAMIVKGIAAGLLQDQPEGSAPAPFNTVCCGLVNYKIYAKRKMLKTLRIFSPYCDLTGDDLNSYSLLLGKHLMAVRGNTGPKMVEKFIHAIIENNIDYRTLPYIKSRILSVTDYDAMGLLLTGLSENAYDQFTYEERIHAIKVLTSKGSMNGPSQEKVMYFLSMADLESDAAKLKEDLGKPNERISKTKEIESGDFGKVTVPNEDANLSLLHLLINGMYDQMIGSQNYAALTQFFINLSRSSPTIFDEALAYYRDPNKLARTIVWDKSYALELLATPPAGTNSYDVTFDSKTDEITIKKSQLKYYDNNEGHEKLVQAMREYARDNDGFLKKFLNETFIPATSTLQVIGYYDKMFPPAPQWEEEPAVKLKPWDLVSFTNKSDLSLLASAVGESAEQKEHQSQFLPAIVLKYAADKKLNSNIGKGVVMAFDVITIVTPVGELAYLGKVANYVYKSVEYGSKVASLGHLAVETGAIPKDSKLGELITECYNVANLMQLGSLGLTLKNGFIAKLSRAEASKFLTTFYGAEKEGMMYLLKDPETVKRIIRFKREIEEAGIAAGYGKTWATSIRESVYSGLSTAAARVKGLPFLKAVGKNNITTFEDASGVVMHTTTEGALVMDRSAVIMAEDAAVVGALDDIAFRTADNAAEIVDDILFVRLADKSVQCIRGACFVAGTPVTTREGLTPIEQVKEGDIVLGVQTATGDTTWQKVAHVFTKQAAKLVRLIAGRDTIFSTPEHPYLTEEGWMSAGTLKSGQRLRLAGKAFVTLLSIMPIDSATTVYNFETAITHNYCVGTQGLVVHNSCSVFDKLKSQFSSAELRDFVMDFKGTDITMARVLAKFDNGKLNVESWKLLRRYPELRTDESLLHQINKVITTSTDPKCVATMKKIMAGVDDCKSLNAADREAFKNVFETMKSRGKYSGNVALVNDMDKFLDQIRKVWMGEGIVARVRTLSELSKQYDNLTAAEKVLFEAEFAGAHPNTLTAMEKNPRLLEHWRLEGNYYKSRSYAGMKHDDWNAVSSRVLAQGDAKSTALVNKLNQIPYEGNDVAAAAIYEGRVSPVVKYNKDAKDGMQLISLFEDRLEYMNMIYNDAVDGGLLYSKLYKDVPFEKVRNAGKAGRHAEVMAVDELARELKIARAEELGQIDVMVRGKNYGSMCRCPHCFYILQGVNMIGNK